VLTVLVFYGTLQHPKIPATKRLKQGQWACCGKLAHKLYDYNDIITMVCKDYGTNKLSYSKHSASLLFAGALVSTLSNLAEILYSAA